MRLIDADALPRYTGYALSANEVAIAVEKAPTIDAVPVVRCKDCVYWATGTNEEESWEYCYWFESEIDGNEFCSYGERKEGAEDV